MSVQSSSSCWYYPPHIFTASLDKDFSSPKNDSEMWIRQYQRDIDARKESDPKTILGWAWKGVSS